MNILVTVCARAGSKGLENKNIKYFKEYPLIYYTFSAYDLFCKEWKNKYHKITLAVNTDSEELIKQVHSSSLPVEFVERKKGLGGDTVSKVEVIKDTLAQVEAKENNSYPIVVDLDLTSPLRRAKDIEETIQTLLKAEHADVAFSMTSSRRNPKFNQVMKQKNGFYKTVNPSSYVTRQETEACYDMNASIYAYKREFLMTEKNRKIFDGNAVGYLMPDTAVLDIDKEEDLELMMCVADYFYSKKIEYKQVKENIVKIVKSENLRTEG